MGALDTIVGDSACGLTNGRTEIHANSLKDPGVIHMVSDQENKTKFHEQLRHKILTNICRFGYTGNEIYAYHSLLEALLDLEALGLSLYSLLGKSSPANTLTNSTLTKTATSCW